MGQFPDDFVWGCATAAYQIEGGWNANGKGPSIWDVWSQVPGNVFQNQTGQIACDSYHKYKEDVQLLKDMSMGSYRFSISWSRVIPLAASETSMQFEIGWFAHAILKNGNYPDVMPRGFFSPRLPTFTPEDSAMILGTADFIGINYYTGGYAAPFIEDINVVSYYTDKDVRNYQDPDWFGAAASLAEGLSVDHQTHDELDQTGVRRTAFIHH
ncbi:unnamed protein product [Sphagnum tenellum]